MKKFFQYLSIIILFSAWGIILTNREQAREVANAVKNVIIKPCSKPLEYSIGEVDPQFGISQNDFIKMAGEAEGVWEKAAEKNLFQYNPDAPFKINLIFDERQAQTLEANKLEENLNSLEMSRQILTKQYASLQDTYNKKLNAYEKNLADYKNRLENYNKEVKYWNEKGGAPEDEYKKLEDEKNKLENLYDNLKDQQKEINKLAGKTNNLVGQENQIVNNYNANLTTYKNKYGGAREFEKGIFDGVEINIYQFNEKTDLHLTLIHELGHYLGLNHVENPQSIMYYLIGEQDLENPILTEEDSAELNKVCKLN